MAELRSFLKVYQSHPFRKVDKLHTLISYHSTKKPVTTVLTYPWKCTVLHCNHLGNTWKPLVQMTRRFDYCPSASVGSSAPVVSRCFPGGYNVKLYISRGRLAWWLLAFLHSVYRPYNQTPKSIQFHLFTFRTDFSPFLRTNTVAVNACT